MYKETPVVIGKYSGKCADGAVFNNNQMKLSGDLFRILLDSDDYKAGIEHRWYIGFLGHPEDPNCMDFKDACIVMTSCRIDENDEVFGEFDLLDTPVGRVVKTLQDAGVVFGISIRGAGDIDANGEVDPESFVFRGFDLVTFPAYNDAVPTFQKVAASTDLDAQVKYKKVCAAVNANLSSITSCEALNVIQSQFSKYSDEYSALEGRKQELTSTEDPELIEAVEASKLEGMTDLYLGAIEANTALQSMVDQLTSQLAQSADAVKASSRKIRAMQRIYAHQSSEVSRKLAASETKNASIVEANTALKEENLKYTRKIEAASKLLSKKDATISRLNSELRETVTASKKVESRTSDLDAQVKSSKKEVSLLKSQLTAFQKAYANVLAKAIGVDPSMIRITASTSVEDIRKAVYGSTSTSNMSSVFVEPQVVDIIDEEDEENVVTL